MVGSHPVWVRGLKLSLCLWLKAISLVAPRVGAWIETLTKFICCSLPIVAPRVGAWIETYAKHVALGLDFVAPRVGAWIETPPVPF